TRVSRSLATKISVLPSSEAGEVQEGLAPRQALISHLFKVLNCRRADILTLMQTAYPTMAYQSVFAATAGETNDVHAPNTRPAGAGRSGSDGPTFEITDAEGNVKTLTRSEFIKHEFEVVGKPRSAIAKELGIAYGTVLSATSGLTKAANSNFDKQPKEKVKKSKSKPAKAKEAKEAKEAQAAQAAQTTETQPPSADVSAKEQPFVG
ncbi:MAG: hypothetical protein ACRDBG_21075, partial [Waterburya sp.]